MSQCTKPDALKVQVGGGHYAKLKIQTVEFVMTNRWDFCAGSIVKYLTRYRDKNGRQDLEKAKHFVQLRQASLSPDHRQPPARLGMHAYCMANDLYLGLRETLMALETWVLLNGKRDAQEVLDGIDALIEAEYPHDMPQL